MIKDEKTIENLIVAVLEDFNQCSTNISSEAARVAIAKAIVRMLIDAPVVQQVRTPLL
tara:strand:- start:1330 stop:1503 length:174 start_codon:yes stop_codon:yes gene_type:complete